MISTPHTLHVFNPSHDEALAADDSFYYPSKAAREMGIKWGALPMLWAADGDAVLLPDEATAEGTERAVEEGIRFVRNADLKRDFWEGIARIEPWGWDLTLRQQLRRAGAPEHLLPTDKALEAIRQLSSRETTAKALPLLRAKLKELGVPTVGESVIAKSAEAVAEFLQAHQGGMVKSLWSCSGRGVFQVQPSPNQSCQRRIERLLREQGAVEIEPVYKGATNFALEFEAVEGKVEYVGISLFGTNNSGKYTGNILLPQERLETMMTAYGNNANLFPILPNACAEVLTGILGSDYTGPLGVDMMWVKEEKGLVLHPCIEVNLRRTMGHAAVALTRRGWDKKQIPAQWGNLFVLPTALSSQEKDV